MPAELPPGIDPNRDPDSHAWRIDPFRQPDMPGTFNFAIGEVALSANTRAGTKARRDKAEAEGDVWPGLTWITTPDNPATTDWEPRPLVWTGTTWKDPLRMRRVRYFPRSAQTGNDERINSDSMTSVLGGRWVNAPKGQYLIDVDVVLACDVEAEIVWQGALNTVGNHADTPDIGLKGRHVYHYHTMVEDHAGGDLNFEMKVIIYKSMGTVLKNGTGLRYTYLGPFNN